MSFSATDFSSVRVDRNFAIACVAGVVLLYIIFSRKKGGKDLVNAPSILSINSTAQNVQEKAAKYTALHEAGGGTKEERVQNAQDMTNYYYDLATDFYEFGWGQSFHFAPRFRTETFEESIVRHEWYIGSRLQVAPGERILDVGCGVGGPMRNIARFTKARVTGINNNAYQLTRVAAKNAAEGLSEQCDGVKGDFMNMPFEDNTFDGVYAIEATVHAPSLAGVYAEIFRVLKPGRIFCVYEWLMTDKYDPNNAYHRAIKEGIEIGNSLPDISNADDVKAALAQVGFELLDCADLVLTSDAAWYEKFEPKCTLGGFKTTPLGMKLTSTAVGIMEAVKLAPPGSKQMHNNLCTGGLTLYRGGQEGIFTPICAHCVLMQSDEPVDPKPEIEKQCHTPCVAAWNQYKACEERVTKAGEGNCEPWYFDYWKCVDKCVAPKLFAVLK